MNLFIVGAGFTNAVFPDAPLNPDLLEKLAIKSPDSACSALRNLYKTEDIEIALTKLDVDAVLSQDEETGKFRQRIEGELANYFSQFRVSKDLMAQLQWLTDLIDHAFVSGDVAISLNYDCVLEGALDCRGKWSPNGGYGSLDDFPYNNRPPKSPVTVLKIHGSANFVIAPYVDKPTARAVGYEVDESFLPHSGKNRHIRFGGETGRSYLIAPSYVKIPTVEITYLMLDALAKSTEAKNLVIIGSALRQEDVFLRVLVTNFLRQPSCCSRKIIVVDLAAEAINNRLKEYWGVDVTSQILPIEGRIEASVRRLLDALEIKRMPNQ